MFKLLLYFLGIIFTSIGIFFTIIYLNLLTMGYTFFEFVKFITSKIEFWFIVIGLICLVLSLERWIKNELLLRHNFKLERRGSI